jgi:flavin reductase (DIM6/NTAB) family NADH-FMN oxidoreductase RutF
MGIQQFFSEQIHNLNKEKMHMQQREYLDQAAEVMARIKKGAFLTVKADSKVNTMTIGWATIGYIWQKPVFMIAVRDSRHTFTLLEKTDNFTVTIPAGDAQNKALTFCGTKSGREFNKFKQCDLQQKQGIHTTSPIIDIPGIHYECKIVYKSAMDNTFLDAGLERLYPDKDYHTLYFGEILACYETG